MSIVKRIFLLIAVTLGLVAGGALFNGLHLLQKRSEELRGDTVQLARVADLDMGRVLDGTHQLLATLAKLPAGHGWDARACSVIEAAASSDFEYDHLVATDRDGIIQCSSNGPTYVGTAMPDRELLDRVVATAGFSVGVYGVGRLSQNEVIRVGFPVVDDAGAVVGTIYAGINLTWLNTAISEWQLGEKATIDITDRNGILIAHHPDPRRVGQPVADKLRPYLSVAGMGTAVVADVRGVSYLYGYVPINVGPSNDLGVFVGRDRGQALADVYRSIWLNAAVILIGLLLSAVFAVFYVRRFLSRPFQGLLTAAGRWRNGDWSARAGAVSGIPEFDRLASAFDGMAAEVSARDKALQKSTQSLRQERDFTAALIDSLPGLFVLIDERGRFVRWNANLPALTGLPSERLQGLQALEIVGEDDRDRARTKMGDAFAQGAADFEGAISTKNGDARTIQFTGRTIMSDDRRYLLAVGTDVTDQRNADLRLRASEERFRAVSEAAQDAIIMIDQGAKIVYWNRAAERILGYTADEAIGKGVHEWLMPQHFGGEAYAEIREFAATGRGNVLGKTIEMAAVRKDGVEIPVEISIASMLLGSSRHAVAILRDITERKRIEAEITRIARHDILTGLANRGVFVETLEATIALARRGGMGFAVLYMDLDHFKDVNDTLGHPVGDLLLQSIAERLCAAMRQTDIAARFGGDEFALIATNLREPADAATLADTVLTALSEPFSLQGVELRTGASIGIAVYGPDSLEAETLLSHADVALYRAKSEGRGTYRFFTDAMDAEVRTRVLIGTELRKAIISDQLFLAYQPQVDICTGHIIGVEALVRWQHPTRGVVMPNEFIPAAEKNGLIVALGHWVMREACRQMKLWLDAGIAPPLIAINLSALQFKTPLQLEKDISAILSETGVPPQKIELELTESALMDASRAHGDVLLRLRKAGFRIAIDDFGTGYSSLDYLRRFPVDRIKIAQQFMTDLADTSGNGAIVQAAIALAHALKLDTMVEGVETARQLELVKTWGARAAQGYYFSKPVLPEQMTALLNKRTIHPVHPPVIVDAA